MANTNTPLTYRDSGVDIDTGNALIDRIKPHTKRTTRPEVMGGLGGFGGLMSLPEGYKQPILVSGTDGVGTKLKLALKQVYTTPLVLIWWQCVLMTLSSLVLNLCSF